MDGFAATMVVGFVVLLVFLFIFGSGAKAESAKPTQNELRRREAEQIPVGGQQIVEYESPESFHADASWRATHGWKAVSVSDAPQRAGVGRFATLGLAAVVLKPKSHVYVVWERVA